MTSELKDNQAGNGRHKQTTATFPKNNPRKTSFQSVADQKRTSSTWPPDFQEPYRLKSSQTQFIANSDFKEDSSDGDFARDDRPRKVQDSSSSTNRKPARDDGYSTSSSFREPGRSYCTTIDNFRVVVMGDAFDGIKQKATQNMRFAASNLLKSPEANQLLQPDF